MQKESSSTTPAGTTLVLTQDMLVDALNNYISVCHDGRVRKGCAAWYRATQTFAANGYRGKTLDQAMYDWVMEKLEAAKPQLRLVH